MIVLLFLPAIIAANIVNVDKNKKSVNLALETSLLFDPKESGKDIALISQFRRFLERLEKAIDPQPDVEIPFRAFDGEVLTLFLKDLRTTILKLDDVYLRNFTGVLIEEFNRINQDEKSTFHKILGSPISKMFVAHTVNAWGDAGPADLKNMVNTTLQMKGESQLTEFTSYLNKMYTENDKKKLNKFLRKIEKKQVTPESVKEFVNFAIFDRYDKLSPTEKIKFHAETKKVYDYFFNKFLGDGDDKPNARRTFQNDLEESDSRSESETARERTAMNAIDSLERNNPIIKEIGSNEILINKDVVINVRRTEMVTDTTEGKVIEESGIEEETSNNTAKISSELNREWPAQDGYRKNSSVEFVDIGDM